MGKDQLVLTLHWTLKKFLEQKQRCGFGYKLNTISIRRGRSEMLHRSDMLSQFMVSRFSSEKLIRFLGCLEAKVEINIKLPKNKVAV